MSFFLKVIDTEQDILADGHSTPIVIRTVPAPPFESQPKENLQPVSTQTYHRIPKKKSKKPKKARKSEKSQPKKTRVSSKNNKKHKTKKSRKFSPLQLVQHLLKNLVLTLKMTFRPLFLLTRY